MSVTEMVVLVNDQGDPVGVAPKSDVHHQETPLHLAFSCYLLDSDGKLLLTRRSLSKKTWAGVWTNSVCGHPGAGESLEDAVRRRAQEELNVEVRDLRLVIDNFRYRAVDPEGTVENEVCPVFIARVDDDPDPNSDEVIEWQWVKPDSLSQSIAESPFVFSPWLQEQFPLLRAADAFTGNGSDE